MRRIILLLALVMIVAAISALPAMAQSYCAWYWDDLYGWYYWCY